MRPFPRLRPAAAVLAAAALLSACSRDANAPVAPVEVATRAEGVGRHGTGAPGSVVFHSDRSGNREIYRMNPDGSGVDPVTDRPGTRDYYPDISPNGKWVVFTSSVGTGPGDIYLIGIEGGTAINLTSSPDADDDWARWSPNGKQIVFHSDMRENTLGLPDYDVYVMDVETRAITPLTARDGADMWPDWSPNGKQVVYRQNSDLVEMNLRTGDIDVLATGGLNQMGVYSPSGQWIAFMSNRRGYCAVWLVSADGGEPENLTPTGSGTCSRAPAWTRDGRILFMSSRPGALGTAVYVMNADGSGVEKLTDEPGEDGGPQAR